MRHSSLALAAGLILTIPSIGQATTRLLLESEADAAGGNEVLHITYATPSDMADNLIASSGFTPLDVDPGFSVRDLAYDGVYRVLLESEADRVGGSEVMMLTYASWDDLTSNNVASALYLPLDVDSTFTVGGFTFDGSDYQILLQSRTDAGKGSMRVLNYAGLDALLSDTLAESFYIPLVFGPHPALGLAYSPFGYSLMLDYADGVGSDTFLWSFASYNDMKQGHLAGGYPPPFIADAGFRIRGIEYESTFTPPSIPEPATWALMIVGLGAAGTALRLARRQQRTI